MQAYREDLVLASVDRAAVEIAEYSIATPLARGNLSRSSFSNSCMKFYSPLYSTEPSRRVSQEEAAQIVGVKIAT